MELWPQWSVSFKQVQFTLTWNLWVCSEWWLQDILLSVAQQQNIWLVISFLSWNIFLLEKWPNARHFYIADWRWPDVLLDKSYAPLFSNYALQEEMSPDGGSYLLHWEVLSHQETNECNGKHWQESAQWLAVSSVCHPLNIITNCFFRSPCPWCCAFSSHGKENKKPLKNGLWPFCCSLYKSNNGGGRQKMLHVSSLHLCYQGGGEGNVWHRLCSFLSKHGYSSVATMACSLWMMQPLDHAASPNCPCFVSSSCKEEIVLSCTGRCSAAAPQQATCALLQSGASVSEGVSLRSTRVIDRCEQRCSNQHACVGPLYFPWS